MKTSKNDQGLKKNKPTYNNIINNVKKNNTEEDGISRYKESLKKEKSIEIDIYLQNLEKISNCRFYIAILSGSLSGALCLTGLHGIAFYLIVSIIFSVCLFLQVQIKKGTFFVNSSNVFTHGIMPQIMVYVIFWVMFYNLVHIY